jgi:hypothetical protein
MGNDQRLDSRTILEQMFWAGIAPPSQGRVQPSAKDAANEPATVLLPQAGPRPVELERALDANNGIQPGETAGEEAPQVDFSAAADRHEAKADTGEPEPAQEIPSVSSPTLQPIENEDAAYQQFRLELQEARTHASLNDKSRGEISELMNTLHGNLDKIEQHGKRADAIVKNMLVHSREGSDEHRAADKTDFGEDIQVDNLKHFEATPDQAD